MQFVWLQVSGTLAKQYIALKIDGEGIAEVLKEVLTTSFTGLSVSMGRRTLLLRK